MDSRSLLFAFCVLCLCTSRATFAEESDEEHIFNNVHGTDDDAASREEKTVGTDAYSAEELRVLESTKETHVFQAEVNKLMGIIINSLYSHTEIFLREIISNASDALDKIRYQGITDPDALATKPELEIRIRADHEAGTLTITDTGVGMTRDELVKNLGTLAQSGTSNFINNVKNDDSLSLIGQFGVGFYSVFLVADEVAVHSKSNDSELQYVWTSNSKEGYTIHEDPKQDLGRGTSIVLTIKEDATEYLSTTRLRGLIHEYSEFIDFPILLWDSHEEEVFTPKEAAEDLDVEEVEEDDEDAPEFVTVWGYERVNDIKPLWQRKSSEITDEEYDNFYSSFTKDKKAPLSHLHFSAEGDINFKAILYIPSDPPANLYQNEVTSSLRLYVRRVFITDDFSEIMPRYLSFIQGVIDSEDLPLNVSREMLQKNRLLAQMKKKLIRKAVGMIQDLAKDSEEKYLEFFEKYATSIKLGLFEEDTTNKARLEKLLRFESSKTDGLTSFEDYVGRMKEGQTDIYFYAAQDKKENMMRSPLIESLLKKGYEVLFMTEAIDEYLFTQQQGNINKYEDHNIVNVARENLELDDEDDEEEQEDFEETYADLTDYLKTLLTGQVSAVSVSDRLTESPCALTSSSWGWTGNMEKLTKAQAVAGNKDMYDIYKGQKRLEINPSHPIIVELKNRVDDGPDDAHTKDIATLMFETALLTSGYELEDQPAFASRVQNMLRTSLGLETAVPEPVVDEQDFDEL